MSNIDPTAIRGLLERVSAVHIGVDLGVAHDFSAVAVVEVGERPTNRMMRDWRRPGHYTLEMESTYRVQRLVRIDLGQSWHAIVERILEQVGYLWDWERSLRERGELQPHEPQLPWDIWADATGLGRPVMELIENGLRATTKTDRARLHPVTFNYGDRFRHAKADDIAGVAAAITRAGQPAAVAAAEDGPACGRDDARVEGLQNQGRYRRQ